jgi:hypothetical protein
LSKALFVVGRLRRALQFREFLIVAAFDGGKNREFGIHSRFKAAVYRLPAHGAVRFRQRNSVTAWVIPDDEAETASFRTVEGADRRFNLCFRVQRETTTYPEHHLLC